MKVRLQIDVDLDGNHSFNWQPSEASNAIDIPDKRLEHWTQERNHFIAAKARWHRVAEEIEDTLYRVSQSRARRPTAEKDRVVDFLLGLDKEDTALPIRPAQQQIASAAPTQTITEVVQVSANTMLARQAKQTSK